MIWLGIKNRMYILLIKLRYTVQELKIKEIKEKTELLLQLT